MKRNVLQNVIGFIVRYIWIFCAVLVVLEVISTMYSATLLLKQATVAVLQAQAGEISGRVDGVLRLLKGFANDQVIGNTELPIYERAIKTISYQESYGLYMIAVLDKDLNMVPAGATQAPKTPNSRADRDYLQRMKETGEYQITDVITSRSDGVTKNYTIAVPFMREGVLEGGVFGAIYLDDIEEMLERENKGEFFLLGQNHTVMLDGGGGYVGKSLKEVFGNVLYGGAGLDKVQDEKKAGEVEGFWVASTEGLSYLAHTGVNLTEWTLVYEGRLNMVLSAVLPLMLMKILAYVALCWGVTHFGRRYLESQLATASHLLDRVTIMQKELFRTEQGDYEGILELTQQGLTDQLTGLSTRSVLIQRFTQFIDGEASKGMLCFLDLDDLKYINDTFGHEMGDCALRHFARVITEYEQKYDGIAARYGGDEFILVLKGLSEEEGELLAVELCGKLASTLQVSDKKKPLPIHGSIGVAFYPKHGKSLEELISKADLALYISKNNGKGCYSVFDAKH